MERLAASPGVPRGLVGLHREQALQFQASPRRGRQLRPQRPRRRDPHRAGIVLEVGPQHLQNPGVALGRQRGQHLHSVVPD